MKKDQYIEESHHPDITTTEADDNAEGTTTTKAEEGNEDWRDSKLKVPATSQIRQSRPKTRDWSRGPHETATRPQSAEVVSQKRNLYECIFVFYMYMYSKFVDC